MTYFYRVTLLVIALILLVSVQRIGNQEAVKESATLEPLKGYENGIQYNESGADSDMVNVFAPLCETNLMEYEGVAGRKVEIRFTCDIPDVFIKLNVTLLELHPEITEYLISFIRTNLSNYGFINKNDIAPCFHRIKMNYTSIAVLKASLDWMSDRFNAELPAIKKRLSKKNPELNIVYDIYPVFLNDSYVTFVLKTHCLLGGQNAEDKSYMRTFNRETGEILKLGEMLKPGTSDKFYNILSHHIAESIKLTDIIKKTFTGIAPLNEPCLHNEGIVFTWGSEAGDKCQYVVLRYEELKQCLNDPFCNDLHKHSVKNEEPCELWPERERGCPYTKAEIDSMRATMGLNDTGRPFPYELNEIYRWRGYSLKRHYDITHLYGIWRQYGHASDPLSILTINPDNTYSRVCMIPVWNGKFSPEYYCFAGLITGKYTYDNEKNLITFLNTDQEEELLTASFLKYEHPEHDQAIVHSIEGGKMELFMDTDMWSCERLVEMPAIR